ncbi:class I SAM-dependent methyltransferase [Anaerospora sp.]|uniref:class I SAM-dependent methyltransferase n=1 Tax=Anaerospora sp. TaxID=1960278 RepID=UPI002898B11B|nr:class I SAM-dependent methyltransferase [Anaerospora sp.]
MLTIHLKKQNSIFTHLTEGEKLKIMELSIKVPGNFVEIGSYLGASASFIAEGILQSGHVESKLYCIDTWQNHAMSEGTRDTFAEFLSNTEQYKEIITPLRGMSTDIARTFQQQIDFIFFDGDHSYEGIKADVNAWLPKVKKGGMVVFHDIGWAEGVQKVIKEDMENRLMEVGRLPNLIWGKLI